MSTHVLFVDTSPFSGGAQRSLLELVRHLDRTKLQPFVLAADDSPNGILAGCRELGVQAHRLRMHHWENSLCGIIQAIYEIIRARLLVRRWISNLDIRVVHANCIRAGLLCALILPRRLPLVFHHRDYKCPPRVLRFVLRRAARTIVVSEFLRQHCETTFADIPSDKFAAIHNGLDPGRIRALANIMDFRQEYRWPEGMRLVTLLADMARWKRHRLFLEAFAAARQRDPRLFAFVIGGARDRAGHQYEDELLKTAEELGLLEHLAFAGHIDNPMPLLKASGAVVSVAESEPFGRVIVEALTLGTPVVVAGQGGPREIVGESKAARVVDDDPESIANGILHWFADDLDHETIAADARATAAKFDPQTHARAMEDVIADAAAEPQASRN